MHYLLDVINVYYHDRYEMLSAPSIEVSFVFQESLVRVLENTFVSFDSS